MAEGWRYIAQRFDGNSGGLGDFIDLNVPLSGVNLEEVLSGHNALTGTIAPEYARLKGPDGRPILEEYGSAIWAESPDGEIRGGGILTRSRFSGAEWVVECTDLTGVSIDLPYTEANFFVNVDPLDLFRHIWTYIQRQRGGNLGISVDSLTSPVRFGTDLIQRVEFDTEPDVSEGVPVTPPTPDPPEVDPDFEPVTPPVAPNRYTTNGYWRDAAVSAMQATGWKPAVVNDALRKWLNKDQLIQTGKWTQLTEKERTIRDRSIERVGWPPNPPNPGFKEVPNSGLVTGGNLVSQNPNPDVPTPPADAPTPPVQEEKVVYEYDAYKLNWYTNLNLDGDIADLSTKTPFDWHLVHQWVGEEIRHHIRLGYPKLGRRRTDLRFVVGENIHTIPDIERDGAEYANEVLVLGAGEGSSTITGRAFREDGRLRKVAVISDPAIQTTQDALARAQQELSYRLRLENVAEVLLSNHPHAPMGSVDLGDEILIEGDLGWIDLEIWCRVTARAMSPDDSDQQTLTLVRTDRLFS